jgi:CHAT domain-containing protein
VPFQALLKPGSHGESFLIESFDVSYVPSASVWAQLSRRDRPTHAGGLLAMAPRPQSLASSAEEVRLISRGQRGAEVLVGSQATEARFLALAPRYRMLHLATYGVLNTINPLFSFVDLRPEGDSDGRLEVHEVFGLNLAADLVVLSACETGVGSGQRRDVPAGDDWVGLVRAFLYAGTQTVLASLWPVDDRATARLMEQFYRSLRRGRSKAAALGDAQRALLGDPDHAAPFYWAAFVLTGTLE